MVILNSSSSPHKAQCLLQVSDVDSIPSVSFHLWGERPHLCCELHSLLSELVKQTAELHSARPHKLQNNAKIERGNGSALAAATTEDLFCSFVHFVFKSIRKLRLKIICVSATVELWYFAFKINKAAQAKLHGAAFCKPEEYK